MESTFNLDSTVRADSRNFAVITHKSTIIRVTTSWVDDIIILDITFFNVDTKIDKILAIALDFEDDIDQKSNYGACDKYFWMEIITYTGEKCLLIINRLTWKYKFVHHNIYYDHIILTDDTLYMDYYNCDDKTYYISSSDNLYNLKDITTLYKGPRLCISVVSLHYDNIYGLLILSRDEYNPDGSLKFKIINSHGDVISHIWIDVCLRYTNFPTFAFPGNGTLLYINSHNEQLYSLPLEDDTTETRIVLQTSLDEVFDLSEIELNYLDISSSIINNDINVIWLLVEHETRSYIKFSGPTNSRAKSARK